MDARGGCCIARYAGGAYDVASKVDRIMLRFRPIAPKPASSGGFVPTGVVPENNQRSSVNSSGRKKRSFKEGESNNRVNKRCGGRKRKPLPEVAAFGGGETVVKTLPLLPETPDVRKSVSRVGDDSFRLWLNVGGRVTPGGVDHVMEDATVALGRRTVAESWVRVERVTDRWVLNSYGSDLGLGRTDLDKAMSLDLDTCPGFVSDSFNNVRWINAAYRRMVAGEAEEDMVVRVVVEEGVDLPAECAAFTCRVRVITCGKEKNSSTLPCDVWRMDCGGFAWRLDTKAALSLGW